MGEPKAVITDSERTTRVPSTLTQELAAVSLAILDKREERTNANKQFNSEIKKLEKRQRDVATQIRAGGIQLALSDFDAMEAGEAEEESQA